MIPERLWRTYYGTKWHLLAGHLAGPTLCGREPVYLIDRVQKAALTKRDLCRKCVELSAERPRWKT